ncbi:aminotransferase class I/II-fold pyridoxal phosphate-dependent enzyme [Streptomyces sp. DSM 118878]
MRRPADLDALRQVLSAALGSEEPVARLARLGVLRDAVDTSVLERPTLVGGGALYGPSSPAPTGRILDALARDARSLDVPQLLVPHVRRTDDAGALRAAGLVPFAAGSECVVRLTGEVDDILRDRVGARQLRDLRRRQHAVSKVATWERIPLTRLDTESWAKDAFVELHRRRATRAGAGHHSYGAVAHYLYGAGHHPYGAEALDAWARGSLADRTELFVRRRGSTVVQAGLLVRSHSGRGVYLLTQAADRDDPLARYNLYLAAVYRLCLDARRFGLDWVHLGRGDAERMRRLGADLFVPLDHWVRAEGLAAPEEVGAPSELSRFAAPPVATVPVPGPARFRDKPRFDMVDLSGNTNPFLGAEARYPHLDTAELARTYLSRVGKLPGQEGLGSLGAGHLLFTSGAVDAVMLLLVALASPGERVCVTPPTFELYAHFARLLRLPVVESPLRGEDLSEIDVEEILAADPRVTILCDPNNPVGTRLDRGQVLDLITRTKGLVVIDEAYVEFSENPSYAGLVEEHDNLIVLRTLSKAWGLASARCGIALAGPGLVDALRRVQVPFGFTDASQRAVRDRLTNSRKVTASIRLIRAERERMAAALAAHPAVERVFPTEANFLLVRLHKHEYVMEQLRGAGIIVADTGRLIPSTCRVSIGTRRANDTLLDALTAAL